MFEGFETVKDEEARKRWFASAGTSLVIYAFVGVGVIILARQTVVRATAEPELDVTFQAAAEPEEAKKEAPPPPPKLEAPRVRRPGRAAPLQPTAIPEGRPSEATPTGHVDLPEEVEVFGDGGDLGGLTQIAPPPPPPAPPPSPPEETRAPDPIDEVDSSFVRAETLSGNAAPTYPEDMRHKGVEAVVRLEVRISAAGDVIDVQLVEGDEPFASAAIAAVETWHYRPATDGGRPVASTRLVDLPFRLHGH